MDSIHVIIISFAYKAPMQVRQSQTRLRCRLLFEFEQATSEQPSAAGKAGLAGLIWGALLTLMALCGNFAGAVEFAQMAGQSLATLRSYLIR